MSRPYGLLLAGALTIMSAPALAQALTPDQQQLRSIYQELVEINTTSSAGSCTIAAQAMSARLKQAGFTDAEMQLIVPPGGPTKGNLVVRLKGSGAKKPLMLLAHLDVVDAKRDDWTRDPFKLVEEDGYFYARGAFDNKAQAAIFVANMMRYKRAGSARKRDLILALTCDEETVPSDFDGVDYLLKHHRGLIDAELALAEGGAIAQSVDGKLVSHGLQLGEKTFQSFALEVTNKGGHSALPVPDNAIVHLAGGLARLGKFAFPFTLTATTRSYFEQTSSLVNAQVGADMKAILADSPDVAAMARLAEVNAFYNASMRTTCVPTTVNAGHATNALPQRAQAVVNCRILPGTSVEEVQRTLTRALDDDLIKVSPMGVAVSAPAPAHNALLVRTVQELTAKMWPGLKVIPTMAAGATDGRFLNSAGIWTYGVSGLVKEASGSGMHGLNERLSVKSLYDAQAFLYELASTLAE
ncbi:MAG: peptidase [Massilia sp.]|jgi:acetylornithine deacetylase/succinyl-diaminopimelate desuccinylase-like protein|nr:peptidase [Massilia sp.]